MTPFETTLPPLPNGPILVAVSGGADSVALLNLLHRTADLHKHPLLVAHYQHGIRGTEAELDARSVADMAAALGLQFFRGDGDVPSEAQRTGESIEMAARRMRHAFLQETASKNLCVAIATGHTADDQAETIFLRLARGTSLRGAGGIRPISKPAADAIPIIRPIIKLRHQQLCDWLVAESIPWHEDSTNDDCAMQRNRIRKKLLPEFESILGKASVESLARSMEMFRDDDDFLESIASDKTKGCALSAKSLSASELNAQPLPIFRRIVAKWLYNSGITPQLVTLNAIERIRELCSGPERGTVDATLGGGWTARRCGDSLEIITPESGSSKKSKPFSFILPADDATLGPIAISSVSPSVMLEIRHGLDVAKPRRSSPLYLPSYCSISAKLIGMELTLRPPRRGDRIAPAGKGMTQKLSDIFTNLKIPRDKRTEIIVISDADDRVIWLPGYAVDESAAVRNGEASVQLKLS